MIEAIKSSIAATPLLQKELGQTSTSKSFAVEEGNFKELEKKLFEQQGRFISPSVRVDSAAGVTILEFRDELSGDVLNQVPSEAQLRAYRKNQAVNEAERQSQLKGLDARVENAELYGNEIAADIARAQVEVFQAQFAAQFEVTA